MAPRVLTNAKILLGGFDLSGDLNAIAIDYKGELLDDTTFTSGGTRVRKGGLKVVTVDGEGFWNGGADALDDALFAKVGVDNVPLTITPEAGLEGESGFAMLAVVGDYSPGGEIGELLPFTVSAESDGDLVRGTIMLNRTAVASANSGAARQVGAVSATQKLYAALHVLAAAGVAPTLDVVVKSDDLQAFGSAVPRITFGQKTAVGSEWAAPVIGPITDAWWRCEFTIAGAGPSFTFVLLLAIQ
jgi:hypothetical protein